MAFSACLQRSQRFAKESAAVLVVVTCGDGNAPVQLTSKELQNFTVQRMAQIWRVSHFNNPSLALLVFAVWHALLVVFSTLFLWQD